MIEGFDIDSWVSRLDDLIKEVELKRHPEVAIACIEHYDFKRKRLDRIQAYPKFGARSEIAEERKYL